MTSCRKIPTLLCSSILAFLLTAAGCSWFDSSAPGQPDQEKIEPFQSPVIAPAEPAFPPEAAVEPKLPKAQLPQYIEVTWEIPAEKVEGYVIRYGADKDHLDKEVRLQPGDVQKVHHEKYGDVFRYLLPNPPRDQTVFVSVGAVSAGHESAPSRVFEVAPEPQEPRDSARSSDPLAPPQ